MDRSRLLWRTIAQPTPIRTFSTVSSTPKQPWICSQCLHQQPRNPRLGLRLRLRQKRNASNSPNPADQPGFTSIVDNPPILIRAGRKHNIPGLLFLATIPITAFVLGCWQVQRLGWKTDLIAKFEDRLVRDPLPLPPVLDPDAIKDFDYRRVYARGKLLHDKEMLIGPRLHDGEDGYLVITPLDRSEEFPPLKGRGAETPNTTILINRGWIPKSKAAQASRDPSALPTHPITVQGLLREPWKKNFFTPDNDPAHNLWHFPDVHQMAEHASSQPVWIEETMKSDLLETYNRTAKGIPVGRPAEVNLRNNHTQYIFTWFSLSLATSIMMWMVVKKPVRGQSARVRRNTGW